MELVVKADDFGKILPAIGTPGGPKVEDNNFSFCKLTEFQYFAIGSLELEIRGGSAGLDQFLSIKLIKSGNDLFLRTVENHDKKL